MDKNKCAAIVVVFIGDEIVVDGSRLPKGTASLVGCARVVVEGVAGDQAGMAAARRVYASAVTFM
jgi:hypothetical protein